MDLLAAQLYDGADLPTSLPTDGYPFDVTKIQVVTKDDLPSDPKAHIEFGYDYQAYFTKRWAEGKYGPESS
jgi:hypothetical protein